MIALPANAQGNSGQTTLTLDQAVQLTLEQHPQLGIYQYRRDEYRGLVDQVGASERPTINLSVEDVAGGGEYSGFDRAQTTLSISWVMQGERIGRRVQAAQTAAGQVDIQQQIEALDLSARTARLFIQSLVTEERLTLSQQAVDQAKNTVTAIRERVSAGSSLELESLQAEVELAERELETEDLQHELSSSRYQLAAQWGEGKRGYQLRGRLFNIPAFDSVEEQIDTLKQNPALTLLATQQRILDSEIELARIEARPQLQFSVGVRRYEATDDVGMTAGVSLPLGKDPGIAGKIRRLRAQQAEYGVETQALQRELDTQLYVLLQEIKHSRHVIETLQEQIIPNLEEAERQAEQAFNAGRLGYQQWSVILNKKLDAQQELLSAFESIHLQHIELQRLTGTSLI
ncbi:MAG: TolC family protein [Porticoccaceae bacterium]